MKKDIKHLTIIAKRWFQRTYGNTYHSCEVHVNGEFLDKVNFTYGYGTQYIDTAMRILQKHGLHQDTEKRRPSGASDDYIKFRDWMRSHRKNVVEVCLDVDRKKDL